MKTIQRQTLAEQANRLLEQPAARTGLGIEEIRERPTPKVTTAALDEVSPFAGLDIQLAASARVSTAETKHNHFRAAILGLAGAQAALDALAAKLNSSPPVPITQADIRSLGPRMRATAEAVEAAVGDGTHKKDAAQLYRAISGFLASVAENAGDLGLALGHKAEIANQQDMSAATKRAIAFWQHLTHGDTATARELSGSLATFYSSAERVLKASAKLLRTADTVSDLMKPVETSFAYKGLWIDAAWNPVDFKLSLSVGGEPIANTWCTGDQIGVLMYEGMPRNLQYIEPDEVRRLLIEEQVKRNGATGAALDTAFDKMFPSQAAVDKAAKAARTTFAPIEVVLQGEVEGPGRGYGQPATKRPEQVTVRWDPMWGVATVKSGEHSPEYEYDLKHPKAKDAWFNFSSAVSPDAIKQALLDELAKRKGDTSMRALAESRVAVGIAAPA
ncbi:MAG: hypothetical protein U1E65_09880 [Myxococcota bacterium]